MNECILILKLLTYSDDHLIQERVNVCSELITEAKIMRVPPALILSIAWIESNWLRKEKPNNSNCAGPLQVKVKYWCENVAGEWTARNKDGVLEGCNLLRRGVFAFAWYIDRFQTLRTALCRYAGDEDCEKSTYPTRVLKKFKQFRRYFK